MSLATWIFLAIGLVLLSYGANLLVSGASQFARRFGISPLVIGLTIVAYGTSAPELVVSMVAAFQGKSNIASANVVGSNIFNILFIAGACALVAPLRVQQQLVRLDVPLMIALSLLFWAMASDGMISRGEGALLALGVVVYTTWVIRASRRESRQVRAEYEEEFGAEPSEERTGIVKELLKMGGGVGLLVMGGDWLVSSAVTIATWLGVSDTVIGLTLIAAGTSLPEVATSIAATIKGERDIAVGNVVGSNIFNIMLILGASGVVAPSGLEVPASLLAFDIPVMVAVAVACLPLFFSNFTIDRWEGALLFAGYVAYTSYLVLQANHHDALPMYSSVMLWFVLPLVVVGIAASVLHAWRTGEAHRAAK